MAVLPPVRPLPLPGALFASSALFGDDAPEADSREACDHVTLAGVYGDLAPRVHRFLRDLLGDATLAADATQETFVRAFRRVDTAPPGTRLVPWVFGIARHVSLEVRRARGRRERVLVAEPDAAAEAPASDARTPESELLDREAVHVVARALAALPEERRAVLLMRLDHGLAYDEIAELMEWSLAKVKVEIFRAREKLRAALEAYRGGEP